MGERDELKDNGGPMAALAALPRLLSAPLDDIRTIARTIQVLPELAEILSKIETRVERLDEEVVQMRQAVESMRGDVGELPKRLDELQDAVPFARRRK